MLKNSEVKKGATITRIIPKGNFTMGKVYTLMKDHVVVDDNGMSCFVFNAVWQLANLKYLDGERL